MTVSDKVFHIQPWSPALTKTAQTIIESIEKVTPELEVLYMGAAALGLPGKNDIDLDILCDVENIPVYTRKLVSVLEEPKKTSDKMTAWEFMKDDFEIDCILSDPSISHVPQQKRRFEMLRKSSQLLEEYKQLKIRCDGLPYDEYERIKINFFERLSR